MQTLICLIYKITYHFPRVTGDKTQNGPVACNVEGCSDEVALCCYPQSRCRGGLRGSYATEAGGSVWQNRTGWHTEALLRERPWTIGTLTIPRLSKLATLFEPIAIFWIKNLFFFLFLCFFVVFLDLCPPLFFFL